VTLSAARFLIASSILAAMLLRMPLSERRPGKDKWLLFGMALSGVALFTPTLYLGLRHTTAVNATLINGMGPLFTGILAARLIGERMTRRQIVGAAVGILGVGVLISGGRVRFWQAMDGGTGDLIVLGAVVLWALYSVLSRRAMRDRSALSASAFSAMLGLPLLVLGSIWETHASGVVFTPQLILPLLFIGTVPGVLGLLSWNGGVRRLGAGGAMMFYNTLPLYGALLGRLFLGESLGLHHLLGGGLIVLGGLWAAGGAWRPAVD
jgi:drug/metabolite transporter (DMT)-like permease